MDVSLDIAASPDAVWEQLAETRHWPAWGASIRSVQPADAVVHEGLTGTVRTVVGVRLPFTITEVDPGRSWSWQVAGIPATGHVVTPTSSGCRATITIPAWAPFYAPVCLAGLRRLRAVVGRG